MTEANITKESIKRERVFEIALGESIKYTLFCSAVVGAGTVFLTLTYVLLVFIFSKGIFSLEYLLIHLVSQYCKPHFYNKIFLNLQLSLLLNRNLKFKKFTSISAKVSFPVMAGLFAFGLVYEKTIHNATVHPENWGLTEYIEKGYHYYYIAMLFWFDNNLVCIHLRICMNDDLSAIKFKYGVCVPKMFLPVYLLLSIRAYSRT